MTDNYDYDDAKMIRDMERWPGETLCLKRKAKPGEPTGITGYADFGVLTNNRLPIIVYLQPNFCVERKYTTVEALLDDGWIVD